MGYTAKEVTRCCKCGEDIQLAEPKSWVRGRKGWTYHLECAALPVRKEFLPVEEPEPIEPVSAAIAPQIPSGLTSEQIVDLINKTVSGMKSTHVSPVIAEIPNSTVKPDAKILNDMIENGDWTQKAEALCPYLTRLLFIGPPGTGKSYFLEHLRKSTLRLLCHEDMTTGDFRGTNRLIPHGTSVITKWFDGPSPIAMREGRAIVKDEIERTSSEGRSLLYNLLDDPAHDTLPSGEQILAKAGYAVFGTSNEEPESLPAPILDRFELVIYCFTPSPAIQAILHPEISPIVNNLYTRLSKERKHYKPLPTVRTGLVYSKLRALGITQENCLRLVYHEAASEIASAMATAKAAASAAKGGK